MAYESIDPSTGERVAAFPTLAPAALEGLLTSAETASRRWRSAPLAARCGVLERVADRLCANRTQLAALMSLEMGKLEAEALAEVDKCAAAARYCAEQAPEWLADAPVTTDASRAFVAYQPLGTVLAVMPWNFPFWQVIRCAVPALLAGNTVLLKHASNVPQCAQALERLFVEAEAGDGVFTNLFIDNDTVAAVIGDRRVHAVALTGSERAGQVVASVAGRALKKCVLELGGSDPFVVLHDAAIGRASEVAVKARFQNAGQSCIAAKRFIVVDSAHDAFVDAFTARLSAMRFGETLAPMARVDLRDELHRQVTASIDAGAGCRVGGEVPDRPGAWYPATVLTGVRPGMPAADDELFGPVAAVLRVADEDAALATANATRYGLGASVWTADTTRGERFARAVESGMAFVNDMVRSDARLPFGGVKDSGYGRELSRHGMLEFTNTKSISVR